MTKISSEIEIEIPFYDVDPMEIVWHGNYIKYFEKSRYHLLDKIKYNYQQMKDSGYAWPVIDVRVKYIKPLVFAQKIIVRATIVDFEYGLKIDFVIRDAESGIRMSKGYTKQVAVDMRKKEMCLVSPEILHKKIRNYETNT